MNGIQKIIDHIEADAAAKYRAILNEASNKSGEIRAQYEKAASDEYDRITAIGRMDAETNIERLGHVAALEAKKQVLATKQEMVSEAFERAAREIVGLPEGDYVALLARLAAEASRKGDEQVVLNESDLVRRSAAAVVAKANELLRQKGRTAALTLSVEPRDIRGGLILASGDIEVNCSVDTLINQNKNELSPKVAGILFD
jgi:V/A-type H+-transporting ATPase subunit E